VVRAAGVESEMGTGRFAGLHQLLSPVLDRLETLPGAAAECAADRVRPSARARFPDRFLVGLAGAGPAVRGRPPKSH